MQTALFLITPGSDWVLRIIFGLLLVLIFIKYRAPESFRISWKSLVVAAFSLRLLFPLAQSISQYYVWSGSEFTKVFITSPNPGILNFSGGYFLLYILNRFWAEAVLSILLSWLFYKFLVFLKKYRARFFGEGETEIGFLAALFSGWPGFTVFIALVFVLVALVSVVRNIFMKEKYTTLGPFFLLAAAAVLALEPYFYGFLGLAAWNP